MNPSKVIRERVVRLTDLPNIGPSIEADLVQLGITRPAQLVHMSPYEMYERLCTQTRTIHDPCLLDVFISITRFMDGDPPRPWWHYTAERKKRFTQKKGLAR